jgi:hypothetical protein
MAGELARCLVAALLASSLGAGRGWGCRGSAECQDALQTDVQMLQITGSSSSSGGITFTFQLEVRRKWRSGISVGDQIAIANALMSELESEAQAHMQGYSSSYGAASVSGGVSVVMPAPDTGKNWAYVLLPVSGVSYSAASADLGMQQSVLAALKGEALAFEGDSRLTENWGKALPIKLFIGQGDTRPTATNRDQAGLVIGRGDPHLINMRGQRFDLYQPGVHVLLQVPRRAKPQDTLLRVEADARRMGAACADLYFQALNITGSWSNQTRGLQYLASVDPDKDWRKLGAVDIKVVRGHTADGISYLNVFVKHLGSLGYPVGGLLGEDDHTAAATPGRECSTGLDLHSQGPAVASFAVSES